jgi:rubrerythrin
MSDIFRELDKVLFPYYCLNCGGVCSTADRCPACGWDTVIER